MALNRHADCTTSWTHTAAPTLERKLISSTALNIPSTASGEVRHKKHQNQRDDVSRSHAYGMASRSTAVTDGMGQRGRIIKACAPDTVVPLSPIHSHGCYTEKATPARQRQYNACANRGKQCSPNETKSYSNPTPLRKKQNNPTNGHTPRRMKPTHTSHVHKNAPSRAHWSPGG